MEKIILVKYLGGSKAQLSMIETNEEDACFYVLHQIPAYVGINGIGKLEEGDGKTPTGEFAIVSAFGIKENPSCSLPYTRLTAKHYWSAEPKQYNQLVEVEHKNGTIRGEHLIEYDPEYRYALVLDYNIEGVWNKGSAIFLHVLGEKKNTQGCIAVEEKYMKIIVRHATKQTRVVVYEA